MGRRRVLSTESSGGGCYARDVKKKVMATKKNENRKMTGKNQEAGLAAGMESENKAQQNTDATKAAQKNK